MPQQDADRVSLMRALFADLAERVDAAYSPFAQGRPEAEFDAWLDERATEVLPSAARLNIANEGVAARVTRAFEAARLAAARLGVTMPELDTFADAGVDIDALAAAMAEDRSLAAVPTPHGLGMAAWVRAFDTFGEMTLLIADEAAREFGLLDSVALVSSPTVPAQAVPAQAVPPQTMSAQAVRWSLRLIPAAAGPPLLGLSFAQGPHVTLPEMLMLQLMRVLTGEPPVDATSFTWLAGSLAQGRLAARHVYDEAEATVRITCREVVSQGPHLGARPPVG